MGNAEWIALGLLLIALIGWVRWRASPEDQKKDELPGAEERNRQAGNLA